MPEAEGQASEETTKQATVQVWTASPAGASYAGEAEPATREFFANVVARRSTYELPWLFTLVPFAQFAGRKVLEVGCGAGYDAFEFCRHGADYTGIDLTPLNPERTRSHLRFYGYTPQVLVGDAEQLMFADDQFDVVFSNGVLHHTPDLPASLREIARVLKPAGECWLIVYHRDSIFHWLSLWLVDHILHRGFRQRSFAQRLSMIEYTTSEALPLVNVYSRGALRSLLEGAGLQVERLWVRKLVKEDLPILRGVQRLYDAIPATWLDCVGKLFGWYLIAKARKPSDYQ